MICVSAHFPNAALPPALLISETSAPRITRNINMPAVPETADISPSLTILSSAVTGFQLAARSPPRTIPINREEYTSFVIRARAMATSGGTNAQNVA